MFNNFMQYALEQAMMASNESDVPVGAVIVQDNREIVTMAYNNTALNPLMHAEMIAIQNALKIKGTRYLLDCNIYVTLEPCQMCLYAISLVKIKRIYFGAYNPNAKNSQVFAHNYSPEIYGGIMEDSCSKVIRDFFHNKRHKINKIPRPYST